jgi:hypothetical protein
MSSRDATPHREAFERLLERRRIERERLLKAETARLLAVLRETNPDPRPSRRSPHEAPGREAPGREGRTSR